MITLEIRVQFFISYFDAVTHSFSLDSAQRAQDRGGCRHCTDMEKYCVGGCDRGFHYLKTHSRRHTHARIGLAKRPPKRFANR